MLRRWNHIWRSFENFAKSYENTYVTSFSSDNCLWQTQEQISIPQQATKKASAVAQKLHSNWDGKTRGKFRTGGCNQYPSGNAELAQKLHHRQVLLGLEVRQIELRLQLIASGF